MSILQRQLRACLAAILVAGLLLVGVASSVALAAPCTGEAHHGAAVSLAHAVQLEQAEGAAHELAACCSTAINCCASAVILLGKVDEPDQKRIRSAWIPAAPSPLHGLGSKVNRHPPRLA